VRGLKLAGQVGAVSLVAALLGLLVWKVATDNHGGVAADFNRGHHPEAKDFTLQRLNGDGSVQLSSLRGRVVVVNFWASWCIPCKKESPRLEAAWKRYRSQGLVVVGIDANDFSSDARQFAAHYHLTYPLLHDGSGKTLGPYGVTGFPETRFIDRRGRFVGEHVIGQISSSRLEKNIEKALRS
jgi:cytochrome c biogenesis protein CcmG, thiol:disulfide interchange protein DsbE